MTDRMPKVSVCMPAYNTAPYVSQAIASVLAQRFEDFELVVCDDASSDETLDVCRQYEDARLRIECSEHRLGQSGNWNRCIELARGEYVMLLHADDELLPGCLEQTAAVLDANDDVGLVHSTVQHVDETGDPLTLQQLLDYELIDRDELILRRLLLEGCIINPAGVLVRRSAFAAAGPFTDQIVWGVDWHMWTRIALRFPLAYLPQPLAIYRQHLSSGTTAVMTSGRNALDETWAIDDVFRDIERLRPGLSHLKAAAIRGVAHRTWCHAERLCQLGNGAAARAGLRNAIRISPQIRREPRVWGLWAATYTGYRWFATAHRTRQRLAAVVPVRSR